MEAMSIPIGQTWVQRPHMVQLSNSSSSHSCRSASVTVGPPNQLQGHLVLLVRLGHREQLVGRRVLGVIGHFVEVAGRRTLAAMNTGFQVGRKVSAVECQELVGSCLGVGDLSGCGVHL